MVDPSDDNPPHSPAHPAGSDHRPDFSAMSRQRGLLPGNSAPKLSPSTDEASGVIESREVFLGTISHELRAPMAALKLSAQLLLCELETPDAQDIEQARMLAGMIDRQADKLVKLVAYLLDVSRSGNGSLPLEFQEVDLAALVEEAAATARAGTGRHEIRVTAPPPILAMVDPARIEQVLANLLDNAISTALRAG